MVRFFLILSIFVVNLVGGLAEAWPRPAPHNYYPTAPRPNHNHGPTPGQVSPVLASKQDCEAIIWGNAGLCRSDDCRGVVLKSFNICRSEDCRSIIRGTPGLCQTRDCQALVNRNVGMCASGNCKAVLFRNTGLCRGPGMYPKGPQKLKPFWWVQQ